MSDPEPLTELDERGAVRDDLPCRHCGYNLRTQLGDQPCPDCGKPIADSLDGYYLRYAPDRWVQIIANGALLLAITVAIQLSTWLLFFLGASDGSDLLELLGNVIVPLLSLAGTWMVTWREPGRPVRALAIQIRILEVVYLAIRETTWVAHWLQDIFGWWWWPTPLLVGYILLNLLSIVASVLITLQLIWIVRRLPRAFLATWLVVQVSLTASVLSIRAIVLSAFTIDHALGTTLERALQSMPAPLPNVLFWINGYGHFPNALSALALFLTLYFVLRRASTRG